MSKLPELQIKYRNLSLSAKGVLGVVGAIIIMIVFFGILAFYGLRFVHG